MISHASELADELDPLPAIAQRRTMPTRPTSAPLKPAHPASTDEKSLDEDDTQPMVRRRTTQPSADDSQPIVRRRTTQPRAGDDGTAPIGRRETKEQAFDRETRAAEQALAWDDDDPRCPTNWSTGYRCWLTAIVSLCTINATLPSALPSVAVREISADLGISVEVAQLTTSLFLLGYVAGPIVWGPASEALGRKPFFVGAMVLCTVFQLGGSLPSANAAALLTTRFLAGVSASAPLVLSGGVLADIWHPIQRGAALSVWGVSVFYGTLCAPSIGGFVITSYLSWRWLFWLQLFFAAACLVVVLFLPETYGPVLLMRRAKQLRREEPEKYAHIYAPLERADNSWRSLVERTLLRPLKMLCVEPILLLITIYHSIVYGLLYGLLSSLPLIFEGVHGQSPGIAGLNFWAIAVGATGAMVTNILLFRRYLWLYPKWQGNVPPEERLYGAMIGGPILVISILWLGWTGAYASISWVAPMLSLSMMGLGMSCIFLSLITYLVDTYSLYAASALAGNTLVRSAFAASMPLWISQMYEALGIQWATTVFGAMALLCVPMPFLFWRYGHRVRGASAFAPCLDLAIRDEVLHGAEPDVETKAVV